MAMTGSDVTREGPEGERPGREAAPEILRGGPDGGKPGRGAGQRGQIGRAHV